MAPMPLEAPQTGALFFTPRPPLENVPPENAAPASDEKGKRIRPGHPDREHDLTTQPVPPNYSFRRGKPGPVRLAKRCKRARFALRCAWNGPRPLGRG